MDGHCRRRPKVWPLVVQKSTWWELKERKLHHDKMRNLEISAVYTIKERKWKGTVLKWNRREVDNKLIEYSMTGAIRCTRHGAVVEPRSGVFMVFLFDKFFFFFFFS
jgi:hypothetical protein